MTPIKAVDSAVTIWKRVRDYHYLSLNERIGKITQAALAEEFGIGDPKKPENAAKQMRNKLVDCGVRDMFSGLEDWYERFRKTVVDGYDNGMTAEEIVASLKS